MSQAYQPSRQRVPVGCAVVLKKPSTALTLMIQRIGAHGEGTWSVPGGWLDPGEEPQAAAARELWEEVGVTIDEHDLYFRGWTVDQHPEGISDLCLWFECYRWKGEAKNTNPDRIAKVEWWNVDHLMSAHREDNDDKLFHPAKLAVDKGLLP